MSGDQSNEALPKEALPVVGVDVDGEDGAVEDADVEMVKSTGMDCGVLVAPVAVTVMVVEYVPAASPATITVAVNELGAVPESGERTIHGAVVVTLQSNVSFPGLEMATVCAAGSLPP